MFASSAVESGGSLRSLFSPYRRSTPASQALAVPIDEPRRMFRQIDANGDGQLTMAEATIGNRAFLEKIFKAAAKRLPIA